jgi:hypothetical protein
MFRPRGLIFRKTVVKSAGKGKAYGYSRTGLEGPEEE